MKEISQYFSLKELAKRTPLVGGIVFFGANSLDVLTNPQTVGAATNCKVGVRVTSYEYIDMYPITGQGRKGKIDPEDVKTGWAVGYNIEIRDQKDGKILDSQPIFSKKDKNGKDIAQGEASITKPCDMNNSTAAELWVNSSQKTSDQDQQIVPNNVWREMDWGRELVDRDAITRFASNKIPDSDPRKQQILNYLKQYSATATPTVSPTAVASATPTTNRVEVSGNVGVDGKVTVEGGQNPLKVDAKIDVTKKEGFLWLPFAVIAGLLGAGALTGIGVAASGHGRREIVNLTAADVEAERERIRAERAAALAEQRRLREAQQRRRDERYARGYRWYKPWSWRR